MLGRENSNTGAVVDQEESQPSQSKRHQDNNNTNAMQQSPTKMSARINASASTQQSTPDPNIQRERFGWVALLRSVLNGDVIRSKLKLTYGLNHDLGNQLFLGLRAFLHAQSVKTERLQLELQRSTLVPQVIEDVLFFRVDHLSSLPVQDQVSNILDRVEFIESLYPSRKHLIAEHPQYASFAVQYNLDALNSWMAMTMSLRTQLTILRAWTGSDNILRIPAAFLERLLKESNVQQMFEKHTLSLLNGLLRKIRDSMLQNFDAYTKMGLPTYSVELQTLTSFPSSLMEAYLVFRLQSLERMKMGSVTLDQSMEDLRNLMDLARRVKKAYHSLYLVKYTQSTNSTSTNTPVDDRGWGVVIGPRYDQIMLQCLRVYFKLLARRFQEGSFEEKLSPTTNSEEFAWNAPSVAFPMSPSVESATTGLSLSSGSSYTSNFPSISANNVSRMPDLGIKDVELLESEWKFLLRLSRQITHGDIETAVQFCFFASQMMERLTRFLSDHIKALSNTSELAERPGFRASTWLRFHNKILENVRLRARKLLMFVRTICTEFENAVEFEVAAAKHVRESSLSSSEDSVESPLPSPYTTLTNELQMLLDALNQTEHALLYGGQQETMNNDGIPPDPNTGVMFFIPSSMSFLVSDDDSEANDGSESTNAQYLRQFLFGALTSSIRGIEDNDDDKDDSKSPIVGHRGLDNDAELTGSTRPEPHSSLPSTEQYVVMVTFTSGANNKMHFNHMDQVLKNCRWHGRVTKCHLLQKNASVMPTLIGNRHVGRVRLIGAEPPSLMRSVTSLTERVSSLYPSLSLHVAHDRRANLGPVHEGLKTVKAKLALLSEAIVAAAMKYRTFASGLIGKSPSTPGMRMSEGDYFQSVASAHAGKSSDGSPSGAMTPIQRDNRAIEFIEDWFTFASDFGSRSVRSVGSQEIKLNKRLMKLVMNWIDFIANDCARDKKTFRWALMALQFVETVTGGNTLLQLSSKTFNELRLGVATCMAIVRSYLDHQYGQMLLTEESERDEMNERGRGLKLTRALLGDDGVKTPGRAAPIGGYNNLTQNEATEEAPNHQSVMSALRQEWMQTLDVMDQNRLNRLFAHRVIGKVLDEKDLVDRNIGTLAARSQSISLRWQQGKFIGGGSFGSVYMAFNLDSGDVMAVKEIRFQDVSNLDALMRSVTEEMNVLKILHHPNIVEYYGVEVYRDKLYIFMEYCPQSLGSLLEHGGRIEDIHVLKVYAKQILKGLEYLHSKNIVHRDIKPPNLLIGQEGNIKIADFGASKIYRPSRTFATTGGGTQNSLVGTPRYIAPEIITSDHVHRLKYPGAADIWSFGCCLFHMMTGVVPWSDMETEFAVFYQVGLSYTQFGKVVCSDEETNEEPDADNDTDDDGRTRKTSQTSDLSKTAVNEENPVEQSEDSSKDPPPKQSRSIMKRPQNSTQFNMDETYIEHHGLLKKAKHSGFLNEEMLHFLMCCLRWGPDERRTASELLQHPFLKDVDESVASSSVNTVHPSISGFNSGGGSVGSARSAGSRSSGETGISSMNSRNFASSSVATSRIT